MYFVSGPKTQTQCLSSLPKESTFCINNYWCKPVYKSRWLMFANQGIAGKLPPPPPPPPPLTHSQGFCYLNGNAVRRRNNNY